MLPHGPLRTGCKRGKLLPESDGLSADPESYSSRELCGSRSRSRARPLKGSGYGSGGHVPPALSGFLQATGSH
jgi:hypothetical protein